MNHFTPTWRRAGVVGAALALSAFFAPAASYAQTLGLFSFTNAAGNEPTFPVDAQPSNATISPMRRGTGVTPPAAGSAGRFAATGFTVDSVAVDSAGYFAFRVVAGSGFRLNLDSLVFTERRSNTGIRKWQVRTSLDNFATPVVSANVPDDNLNRRHLVDLTAAAFNTPNNIEFRFYGYGAEGTAGTWRLDDVKLLGVVESSGPAVPTVQFGAPAQTVAESAGTVQIPVTLTNPGTTATTVEVHLATNPGSATTGTDYTFGVQTLTFAAGSSATQFATLAITDDTQQEPGETVVLQLMAVTAGGAIGVPATMTVNITDNDGGTGPLTPPLSTIAAIKLNDAQGSATNVGTAVRVRGIVLSQNLRATGFQSAIQDNTGGIGLFAPATSTITFPAMSDSVELVGVISQFRGLSQIVIDSFRVLVPNAPMPAPMVVTTLDEAAESKLVKLNGPFTLVDVAQWTAATTGFNVDITDGTNTFSMRVAPGATTLVSAPAPTQPFRVTGIGAQFVPGNPPAPPFLTGYQITPRGLSDLEFVTGLSADAAKAAFALFPNPAADRLTLETATAGIATVVDATGRVVLTTKLTPGTNAVAVNALHPGLYVVRVGNAAQRFAKQ